MSVPGIMLGLSIGARLNAEALGASEGAAHRDNGVIPGAKRVNQVAIVVARVFVGIVIGASGGVEMSGA